MAIQPSPNPEVTLSFSAPELAQLEAFAALHGQSVADFVRGAALDAAHIASPSRASELDTTWMSESAPPAPTGAARDLFALDKREKARDEAAALPPNSAGVRKRGVAGEPSQLARGSGLVWEIRRALGQERVHGLGWTREHLAFVLKLSVVGVRKMERLGTTPIKSLEARRALLKLARTLEKPTPEIAAYIAAESAELGNAQGQGLP